MIKTINLTNTETKITELGGDNTEIINNSSGIVYASKMPNITVGGDDVIAIPAGSIDGLYGTHGTVYILGSGSVELRGVDHHIAKARGQAATDISGTGVSASYVDEKCSEILKNANAYTDIKNSDVVVSVKEYTDEKNAQTLDSVKKYADSLNAELAGYIGYTDSDIYGLEADFENCVFTRLAGAVGKNAGADFDSVNAYGGRRRCNLSDDGEVLAYYGDENFKADGSNGQVMVEQPKFYYRVVPLKTEKIDKADGYHLRKARYYISDTPKAGFKVHPAFVRNNVEVDKIYLSAFEGCIYDTSAEIYLLEDEQIADFDNDKLSSIADAKPCSGTSQRLTRANARKLARNRGSGWTQWTAQASSVTQLLFIIEYAAFDAQREIGMGITSKTDDGKSNLAEKTGMTLSVENRSGSVLSGSVSFRGEENVWGNIWTWVDGINVNNPTDFSVEKSGRFFVGNPVCDNEIFTDTNIPSLYGNGAVSAFGYSEKFDWLFLPTELKGNTTLPVGDFCWNINKNGMAAVLGGYWCENDRSGIFYWLFNYAPANNVRAVGARLVYYPIK